MRWTTNKDKRLGYRVRKIFAIFPYRIDYEVRWLELVYIRQSYMTFLGDAWWTVGYFTDRAEYEDYLKAKVEL